MTIDFACSKCGAPIHAPLEAAGLKGSCNKCGEKLIVPTVAPAPTPTAGTLLNAKGPAIPVVDYVEGREPTQASAGGSARVVRLAGRPVSGVLLTCILGAVGGFLLVMIGICSGLIGNEMISTGKQEAFWAFTDEALLQAREKYGTGVILLWGGIGAGVFGLCLSVAGIVGGIVFGQKQTLMSDQKVRQASRGE